MTDLRYGGPSLWRPLALADRNLYDYACPGVPAAVISNLSGSALRLWRLQRSGYVFGRSDWCYSTEDMPRMCLCVVSIYWRRTVSKLLTPKVHQSYRKTSFWRKATTWRKIFKILLRKDSYGHWLRIPAKCRGKQYTGSDQTGAWYSSRKKSILPLSHGLLERSRQKFYKISLSPFPISLPSFVQIRPVFEQISENVFQTHYNIGVKPVGFLPTIGKFTKITIDKKYFYKCSYTITWKHESSNKSIRNGLERRRLSLHSYRTHSLKKSSTVSGFLLSSSTEDSSANVDWQKHYNIITTRFALENWQTTASLV